MSNPQEHLDIAADLLNTADQHYTADEWERAQVTILLARAQAHIALAKAQRYLAVSE